MALNVEPGYLPWLTVLSDRGLPGHSGFTLDAVSRILPAVSQTTPFVRWGLMAEAGNECGGLLGIP